jgi:hypothetical protein
MSALFVSRRFLFFSTAGCVTSVMPCYHRANVTFPVPQYLTSLSDFVFGYLQLRQSSHSTIHFPDSYHCTPDPAHFLTRPLFWQPTYSGRGPAARNPMLVASSQDMSGHTIYTLCLRVHASVSPGLLVELYGRFGKTHQPPSISFQADIVYHSARCAMTPPTRVPLYTGI